MASLGRRQRCPNNWVCNAFKAKDPNKSLVSSESPYQASVVSTALGREPASSLLPGPNHQPSQSLVARHGQAVLQQRIRGGGRVQPAGAAGRRRHRARVHAPLHAAQEALRHHLPLLLKEGRQGKLRQSLSGSLGGRAPEASRCTQGEEGSRRRSRAGQHRPVPDFFFLHFSNNCFHLIVMFILLQY